MLTVVGKLLVVATIFSNNFYISYSVQDLSGSIIADNYQNDSKILFNFFSSFFTTTTTEKINLAQITWTEITPALCNLCQCGIANIISTKIVNGTTSRPNYYPWTVYLTYKGRFYTGGVVISNRYILTAAHSANIQNLRALRVIFLDHSRIFSSRSEISFSRKVSQIIVHRLYSQGSQYNNDIALIKLDTDLSFPHEILRPICLPKNDESTYAGAAGVVTGWGTTSENGNFAEELQEAQVNIFSNEDCIKQTEYGSEITGNMICAGFIDGGIDACKGDSGGPLQMLDENNSYTLIGLVSWGRGCAEPRNPGVYTRVSKYVRWIQENTKDACYCL